MQALRIMVLCVCAALICASLRTLHPQLASAVALAAGIAALMMSSEDIGQLSQALQGIEAYFSGAGDQHMYILKVCALALVAEFASDICRDAGESTLAHRIDAGVKLGIVASALPTAGKIMERIAGLLA